MRYYHLYIWYTGGSLFPADLEARQPNPYDSGMQNDLEILSLGHQFLQVHRRASLLSADSDPFESVRANPYTSGNFLPVIQVYSSRYDTIAAQDYVGLNHFRPFLKLSVCY